MEIIQYCFKRQIKVFQPAALLVILSLLGGCGVQRDREDARAVAARVHSQMLNRNFAAIYAQSASGFKTIDESEFVTRMNELQDRTSQRLEGNCIPNGSGFQGRQNARAGV